MQDVEGEGPGPWGREPEDRGKEKRLAVHRNLPESAMAPTMPAAQASRQGRPGAIPSAETVLSHACDKG